VNVAVVGLGLMGGSLARDLSARGHRVTGADADADTVAAALREGVLHASLGMPGALDAGAVAGADVVILAVPVDRARALLHELAPALARARLVTDVGSTKADIVAAAQQAGVAERFVGSHPLAGHQSSGWAASRRDLFSGATVYLCAAAEVSPAAMNAAQDLWAEVGAVTQSMDAAEHDRQLAWTSHLPQLLATSLGLALRREGWRPAELGSGGRDMTRLAGSDPAMWTGIALQNREELLRALDEMRRELDALRAAMESGDSHELHSRFTAAREWVGNNGAEA
jgi:cyclohexadieny/prephenate dehydrogenase / 3-phosphoshikimate 1-carboxyvinyltransferase